MALLDHRNSFGRGLEEIERAKAPDLLSVPLLACIADEDRGRANPMLGFMIALPISLAIWALAIGTVWLVWKAIAA